MIWKFQLHKLVLLSCLFFGSCNRQFLRVQVDYLSRESLASYHVGTPDHRLKAPPVGQRMIVAWYFPGRYFKNNEITFKIKLHFGNHTEEIFCIKPMKNSGFYNYFLLNEDFFTKNGLLSYKVEAYAGSCLIKEWKHQLWVELIQLDP